jgi:exonuclease VII small subunit
MIYFLSCFTGVGDRIWCGDGANPPGIFASFLIHINPFRDIPILRDWGISASSQMYGFITTEEQLSVNTRINIIDDLTDMRNKVQRFFNLLTDFSSQFGNQLSTAIQNALLDFQNSTTSFIAQLHNAINGEIKLKNVITVAKDIWKTYTTDIKHTARHIIDDLEFDTSVIANNFTELIESEIARIGRNIDSTISKIRSNVMSLADRYTGFGFRFAAFVEIFNLKFPSMDIELIYSVDSLGRCSKFQEVYEIMKGEKAFRILARVTVRKKLGYFLSCEVGTYLSTSMSIRQYFFVMHIHLHVDILGMTVSGDLLINNNGMLIRIEGNIWKVFFARIELSSEVGKKWHDLIFNVKGTFGVAVRGSDFEGSLLDGMRQLARELADSANNRLQAAQERISRAQSSLASAQKRLTDAQAYIEKCHSKFDDTIERLEAAKNTLEKAKAPYQDAVERLRKAQRNINNLCKIRSCNSICIPGGSCSCSCSWSSCSCSCSWSSGCSCSCSWSSC